MARHGQGPHGATARIYVLRLANPCRNWLAAGASPVRSLHLQVKTLTPQIASTSTGALAEVTQLAQAPGGHLAAGYSDGTVRVEAVRRAPVQGIGMGGCGHRSHILFSMHLYMHKRW